ncbi:hypothetical protein QBC39DRAFT_123677 [Podospora conica]|nr:hypothetical protein QBC39DRAFT_123677 [Schizothecium conicum]
MPYPPLKHTKRHTVPPTPSNAGYLCLPPVPTTQQAATHAPPNTPNKMRYSRPTLAPTPSPPQTRGKKERKANSPNNQRQSPHHQPLRLPPPPQLLIRTPIMIDPRNHHKRQYPHHPDTQIPQHRQRPHLPLPVPPDQTHDHGQPVNEQRHRRRRHRQRVPLVVELGRPPPRVEEAHREDQHPDVDAHEPGAHEDGEPAGVGCFLLVGVEVGGGGGFSARARPGGGVVDDGEGGARAAGGGVDALLVEGGGRGVVVVAHRGVLWSGCGWFWISSVHG